MAHRVAQCAEADLDDIWVYVAKESGSMEVASRLVDSICGRFFLLSRFPQAGRRRDEDFGEGMRSFPVGEYVILYCIEEADGQILRVVHGRRDLEGLIEL